MNRVIGSVIIVVGLYSVLWGKYKEGQEENEKIIEEIPEAIKENNNNINHNNNGQLINGNYVHQIMGGNVEEKAEVAIDLQNFNLPMKATQQV